MKKLEFLALLFIVCFALVGGGLVIRWSMRVILMTLNICGGALAIPIIIVAIALFLTVNILFLLIIVGRKLVG